MSQCPFRLTQRLVQKKWTIVILQNLRARPVRFNELSRRIPQVQTSVLNRNLVQLQNDGLIERIDFHESPFHVEYALTELGREFLVVIDAMETFAKTYAARKKVADMEPGRQPDLKDQIQNELTSQKRQLLRLIVDDKEKKAAAHWINNNGLAGLSLFATTTGQPVLMAENVQTMPATCNHSGHSMIDGPVKIEDEQDTEENRKNVHDLVEALIQGNLPAIASHFSDNIYINHNPEAWDGVDGFQKALKARMEKGIVVHYDHLDEVIADGNFVVTETSGTTNGKPTIFMDIFRLENGKVREHWDVVQIQDQPLQSNR